ncbi:MAG: phosphoribosylamine--glycine ligase [Alphaproteobacteria bacterium]|nr:phosphoribosylamine--glycine ligase [Alphaproteobacteria bacterium]
MRVLVVGSGGREHALCWAIGASPLCTALFAAPGNAGIAREATLVPIEADDLDGLVAFARRERIDFVVVGPEAPLVAGLADQLRAAGIKTFGPSAAAARLEGSKAFTKDICDRYGIPTAGYRRFSDHGEAVAHVRAQGAPIVVKADGLTAGKGVTVAMTERDALAAIDEALLGGRFGAAGTELVIEDYLEGEEVSFFALVDGKTILPLAAAQDHKRVGDGDTGPNTGGMGAYSPTPAMTPALEQEVMARIVEPIVRAMAAEGSPFTGVLYAGLMLTKTGPQLVEINVRFGDPECQVLMARLRSDPLPAFIAAADGVLDRFDLRWSPEAALTVVMASKGYPGAYGKGSAIAGLDRAAAVPGVTIFHAATKAEAGRVLAVGGRVLGVTALGADIAEARARAYAAVDLIDWPAGFCRRDIAAGALEPR